MQAPGGSSLACTSADVAKPAVCSFGKSGSELARGNSGARFLAFVALRLAASRGAACFPVGFVALFRLAGAFVAAFFTFFFFAIFFFGMLHTSQSLDSTGRKAEGQRDTALQIVLSVRQRRISNVIILFG